MTEKISSLLKYISLLLILSVVNIFCLNINSRVLSQISARTLRSSSKYGFSNHHYHKVYQSKRMSSFIQPTDGSDGSNLHESTGTAEASLDSVRPSNGLLIYYHEDCYKHNIPDHPEQPDRVTAILDKLKETYADEYFREAPLADRDHLLLFHTERHVNIFTKIADYVESENAQKRYGYKRLDDDTCVMWDTRAAALRAVGAVIQAVDDVFAIPNVGVIKSAFCCVRPPGHHAERNRAMGFCFLNNVGIAAKYAQTKYGLDRVAVVDFDVHHGNGSEEGFKDFENLFFGSTHEKENYPGTGWDPSPLVGEKAQNPLHRRIVNRYLSSGTKSRDDFKKKWQEVIDEMVLFKPQLIIISAGFDAHDFDPLSGTNLLEEDFAWATQIVVEASRKIDPESPPPIISSLEGGYNLEKLASSAAAHVDALARSNTITEGEEKGFGGDEIAALAAHVESLGI